MFDQKKLHTLEFKRPVEREAKTTIHRIHDSREFVSFFEVNKYVFEAFIFIGKSLEETSDGSPINRDPITFMCTLQFEKKNIIGPGWGLCWIFHR